MQVINAAARLVRLARARAGMGVLLLVLAAGVAGAAVQPSPDAAAGTRSEVAAGQLEELDEVHVRGTRLWQMRREIVSFEDRIYARYNELNTNDDFDVNCGREARLGTRIAQRVCRVQYYEDAQAEYASALFSGYPPPPSPEIVELERGEEFRRHMLAVINGDRELRRLIRERDALEKRYLKEREKRFEGRVVLFEWQDRPAKAQEAPGPSR